MRSLTQTPDRPFMACAHLIVLGWTIIFLVLALIAAALGFTGVAGVAAGIAKMLFVVFLVVFVISLIIEGMSRVKAR